MTEPVQPTPDELREQAETDTDRVLGGGDYDHDPAALAWARAHIQEYLDRLTEFEAKADKDRNAVMAYSCGIARQLTQRHFLGDGGSTVGVFDERRPAHLDAIRAANDGPSVQEAAADDRRWWDGEKGGE